MKLESMCSACRFVPLMFLLVCFVHFEAAATEWELDQADSTLNFMSVKKGRITEFHKFTSFQGRLSKKGNFELLVDLASVDTGIDIRDMRMRQFLFLTEKYPQAKIQGQLESNLLDSMVDGSSKIVELKFKVDLHGIVSEVPGVLRITKINSRVVHVASKNPMIIDVETFGMGQGIVNLKKLAGLQQIVPTIPVWIDFTVLKVPSAGEEKQPTSVKKIN